MAKRRSPPSRPWSGADATTGVPTSRLDTTSATSQTLVRTPLRVNGGIAYDDRARFSIAADVHYYAAQTDTARTEGVQRFTSIRSNEVTRNYNQRVDLGLDSEQVVDFSLGAEIAVSAVLALRAEASPTSRRAPSWSRGTSTTSAGFASIASAGPSAWD